MTPDANTNMDFHRFDEQVRDMLNNRHMKLKLLFQNATCLSSEQVNLLLEFKSGTGDSNLGGTGKPDSSPLHPNLKRKFIRCSSLATVTHLKKYIAKKLLSSIDKYKDIDVMCNGKTKTLAFID